MENRLYFLERMAGLVVGAALVVIGLFMVVLGLTLLPVIGILFAIPVMTLSLYFLVPEMQLYTEEEANLVCLRDGTCCAWSPVASHSNAT